MTLYWTAHGALVLDHMSEHVLHTVAPTNGGNKMLPTLPRIVTCARVRTCMEFN